MKKGLIIIIIIFLIFIILGCGVYINLLTRQIIELSEYKDNINNNVQENNVEESNVGENGVEDDKIQEDKSIDIEFVRTYIVLANLNQTDATGEYNFYVVDKFQDFDPIVIKVDKKYTLKENQNYEFTFKGSKIEGKDYSTRDIFDVFDITNIEKTNKLGMEQTQDAI